VLGGGAGALNRFTVLRGNGGEERPPMASKWVGIKLNRGERVRLETPGGGGYGPPGERAATAISRDIVNGSVTPTAAERDYGKRSP
jgi:N-methylhydantoinase B